MKKNLLILCVLFAGLTTVFGQTEWTSLEPLNGNGQRYWYDVPWAGSYDIQKGSVWSFSGTYPDAANVDSVVLYIGINNGTSWAPDTANVQTVIEKDGTADGEYAGQLTVPLDWPSVDWDEAGVVNNKPIIQTRIGYDTTVYAWGVPNAGPGDCYHNLIGGVCDAYTDSIDLLFADPAVTSALVYTTQAGTTANADLLIEMKKGVDSLYVTGNYGITDFDVLTIGTYELANNWAFISADIDTIVDATVDNPGIYQYYYMVDPSFVPTSPTVADADGRMMIQLKATYTGGVEESIWFWGQVVDFYTPDSVAIIEPTSTNIEFMQNDDVALTLAGEVFPDDDANGLIVWSIDDNSVVDIDAATGEMTWTEHDFANNATADVTVTATVNDTITATVDLTVVNNIPNGLEDVVLSRVNVYPNPATTELNIVGVENAVITVHNLLGAKVMSTELENSVISIESLPAGTYFVEIATEQASIVKKIHKQ